ncbi:MAG: DegV family protein, partial [Raoultibacter sp.]
EHYENTGELPKTSGSTPEDFTQAFNAIEQEHPGAQIVHLAYSAVTTCSYESALTAAEGHTNITSYDTKSVTAGQAMVVLSIAELLKSNPDLSNEALDEAIHDRINRIRMAFLPGSLEFLRAGGRLSNAAYLGAHLLRIKPVVEILEGKLVATKKYRGSVMSAATKLMTEYPQQENLDRSQVFFIKSEGLAQNIIDMAEAAAKEQGFESIQWISTGNVISSHAGPGAFGIVGFTQA